MSRLFGDMFDLYYYTYRSFGESFKRHTFQGEKIVFPFVKCDLNIYRHARCTNIS